jgi:thiol-disulfide isomerase/thioredoxin
VRTQYGDIKRGTIPLAESIKPVQFELQHLRIGQQAPEIEGEDLNGKPMKLSSFRGKVVVLDFWANWCGYCVQMYPQEREMVKRLSGKPFVLLGVNGDGDRNEIKQVVAAQKLAWRSWWDGGNTGRPINRKWNILSIPTVFVLDAKGVIRYKRVRGKAIDDAVDHLLKELEQPVPTTARK